MGIRILLGHEQGDRGGDDYAVLYDSVTDIPLSIEMFATKTTESAEDAAERFLKDASEHFGRDLREVYVSALRPYQTKWFRDSLGKGIN